MRLEKKNKDKKVPDGWNRFRLIETASIEKYSFTGGPFGSNLKSNEYTDKGIRIIQLQNIGDGCFFDKYKIFTSEKKADELFSCNIFPGDIILSKMGDPVARATIIPNSSPRYLMASDGIRLSIDKRNFDTKFILESINFRDFRMQAEISSTGTTRKRIGLTELRELTLFSPPLPEQKKIAKILTSVDEVIATTETQINKLKDLKKAMMNELLTKGIGHTEFKDSVIGRIPVEWKVVQFNDIATKIQDGTHFSPKTKTGEFIYLTSKNIKMGRLDLSNIQYISVKEHEEIYRRCDVKQGDILLTKDGAMTGNCAMNSLIKPFSLLSSVAFIRCNNALCFNNYLFQYITSGICQNEIKDLMTGNAITRLTLQKIKALRLIMPPFKEQQKIASILTAIDTNIEKKQTKLTQTKNLKKSLMADLLTGRVRVKVN